MDLGAFLLPAVAVVAVFSTFVVGWMLYSNDKVKKDTKGKVWAEITLENRDVWSDLCEYHGNKIKAPWNKGKRDKDDDRIQEFIFDKDHIFRDKWPPRSMFQVTVPKVYLDEKKLTAQLPQTTCDCGHPDCKATLPMQVTPDLLGMLEREKVTSITMEKGMIYQQAIDKFYEMITKFLPPWVFIVFMAFTVIAFIALGAIFWIRTGQLLSYWAPEIVESVARLGG